MNIATVLTGLQTVLSEIDGVTVYDHIPERLAAPAIVMAWDAIEFSDTFEGEATVNIAATVLVKKANLQDAQTKLVDYVNPTGALSVVAAVEADKTLDGSVDSARVIGAEQQEIELAGTSFLAAKFTVEVYG